MDIGEIWSSHSGVAEDAVLQGCYAAYRPASIAAALLGPLDPGNEVTNTSK
jgi:hypothetical protein